MKTSTDFIVLDSVPRAKVAKALVEQSRTDMGAAIGGIEKAFRHAADRVSFVRSSAESAPLYIAQLLEELTVACGTFYDAYTAAVNLFDAGQGLIEDEPEPPKEEVPSDA